jgi:hypothetical protein
VGHAKAFGCLFADTLLAGFNYRRSFGWDENGELVGGWYNTMAQAVSRLLFIAKTWVRSQTSLFEGCGGQSGTGTGFFF